MRFIYTKAFAIFSACILGVVILIFLQAKGWLDPLKLAIMDAPRPVIFLAKNVTLPIKSFFSTVYQLHKISEENVQLQYKVIQLQQSLVQEQEDVQENTALKKELGFVQGSKLSLIACTVLSQNPFGFSDALVLNCGTNQGVAAGQAIISQGYLAGKIIYASEQSSTAILATNSNFSSDAEVSQTAATGIVTGSFNSGLILDQVPQGSNMGKGSLVVTAGINPEIPKDILIGEVGDYLSSSSSLFQKTTLLSPLDFSNLGFVFVVKE